MIRLLKTSLKKRLRLIIFSLTPRENKIMIILDMLLLKMAGEEGEDLVTLISQAIFQIFSKIFLVKVSVEEEDLENLTIEVLT